MASSAPFIAPIAKPLLAEAVHDQLLVSVVRGEFAPGERLNLGELAASCGVSRTPIREAVTRLAQSCLVDVSRNCCVKVSPLRVADMRVRAYLLGGTARAVIRDPATDLSLIVGALRDDAVNFVRICTAIAAASGTAFALGALHESAGTLALFLEEGVAERHGVRIDRARFAPAAEFLLETLDGGDRQEIAAAIDDYMIVVAESMLEIAGH